ncbi:MAG TPA: Lrp/AsnC family transcriptional regulator [Coriobacteriia bacterium]|nr:Lrp/AsnC family transcriptional regulator [Coriobacteriia bacterium]
MDTTKEKTSDDLFTAEQKELLALAQSKFPITADPYAALGEQMGMTGDEAYAVMQSLHDAGYIRRLGPAFNSYRLGYVSTLCAVSVPDEKLESVTEYINGFYNITHNYLRENDYNVWFTVIAHGDAELQRIVGLVEENAGSQVLQLPALRLFKIKVDFNVKGVARAAEKRQAMIPKNVVPIEVTDDDIAIIRAAQVDILAGRYPFKDIAEEVSRRTGKTVREEQVVDTLQGWRNNGTIRRFGITLFHQKAGFDFNVMGVWDVKDEQVEEAGAIMAMQDEISHCYERPRVRDWQSNLYTMIHGQSLEQCDEAIASIRSALAAGGIEVEQPQKLYTLRELKKKSMKYFYEE